MDRDWFRTEVDEYPWAVCDKMTVEYVKKCAPGDRMKVDWEQCPCLSRTNFRICHVLLDKYIL